MKYEFKKPYEFDGDEYTEIEVDIENLKGSDIAAAKKQFASSGNFAPIPAADSEFCAMILASASGKPLDFFTDMPAKDYFAITQQVSNFLLA